MSNPTTETYEQIAKEARKKVLEMIYSAQTSHIGSNFSCIDILTVLFEKMDLDKDKFILSKGWAAASLYYFLWKKGKITENELNSYCQTEICPNCKGEKRYDKEFTCSECGGSGRLDPGMFTDSAKWRIGGRKSSNLGCGRCDETGKFIWEKHPCEKCGGREYDDIPGTGKMPSKFIGLSEPIHPDIPFAGGSMGMGLPAGVGFALAKKINKEDGAVYVLISDGEMQCGTTWESTLIAAQHKLNNLVVIIDANGFQAMGKTNDILSTSFPLQGWEGISINGHHFGEIEKSLEDLTGDNLPKVIMANTIKGKGVSFMENNNLWHYKAPSDEEYQLAIKELK